MSLGTSLIVAARIGNMSMFCQHLKDQQRVHTVVAIETVVLCI